MADPHRLNASAPSVNENHDVRRIMNTQVVDIDAAEFTDAAEHAGPADPLILTAPAANGHAGSTNTVIDGKRLRRVSQNA
ncbi:MAG: hypothetical protein DI589_08885 [Shinella sp.]|nr:MAG: hypothetical protein DI589_08885 [Shinella sp.]